MVPSWHKKKKRKRAGSELGRGFVVRPSIGCRSSGGRSDRIKLHSFVLVLPKKGRFGVGAGLRGQTLDRPLILGGSVGPD